MYSVLTIKKIGFLLGRLAAERCELNTNNHGTWECLVRWKQRGDTGAES